MQGPANPSEEPSAPGSSTPAQPRPQIRADPSSPAARSQPTDDGPASRTRGSASRPVSAAGDVLPAMLVHGALLSVCRWPGHLWQWTKQALLCRHELGVET